MHHQELILIIDFGSQFTQLITRRVREANVYSEIYPHTITLDQIKKLNPSGIILSGGPMSVYDDGAPHTDSGIFKLNVPILGICYGHQLISLLLGGKVVQANDREYGKALFKIKSDSTIFDGVKKESVVWMSHGDYLDSPPPEFSIIGTSDHSPVCAMVNEKQKIYGIQFHPEVMHTEEGKKIIHNFLFKICKCKGDWTTGSFIEDKIKEVRETAGTSKVICALSGGVDSTVAAVLLDKALGKNLTCIHIDTGMMRKNESRNVLELFENKLRLKVTFIDASEKFISRLSGVEDPEEKRKIIGNTFIELFEEEALKIKNVKFLVQGTLYPDVIESVSVKGASTKIKSHHNVGGLPEKMHLQLIEPFRELFKDEVRNVGTELGIPSDFINRHPFPGPGLAVRIVGAVTKLKLEILRDADEIFINEIKAAGLYDEIWQAFAVLLPVQSVGVMGDARTYENVLALRAVTSADGMTADWYRFNHDFLASVSNKIINKVRGINRVVYDISSKPPSTIEWE